MSEYQRVGRLRQVKADMWRSDALRPCPQCGDETDTWGAAAGSAGRRPENGDYAICFRCGGLSRFVVGVFGLAVRAATTDEITEFDADNPGKQDEVIAWNSGGTPGGEPGGEAP